MEHLAHANNYAFASYFAFKVASQPNLKVSVMYPRIWAYVFMGQAIAHGFLFLLPK